MSDKLPLSQHKSFTIGVSTVIAVLCIMAYAVSCTSRPLLDETYLLELMRARASNSIMTFLTAMIDWTGPLPEDSWGFLGSSIFSVLSHISGQSIAFLRVVSITFHALNAFLLFLVGRDAFAPSSDRHTETSSYLAAGAAFIFSVYPLAPEAVSWLGGMAYEIGTSFWLLAFLLYMKGKRERDWTTLGVSWISFLLAVLSDNSLWSSGFIIVALELARSFIGPHKYDETVEVASEDEVFEDAVDRMMEDSLRGHGYYIANDGKPEPIKTPDPLISSEPASAEHRNIDTTDSSSRPNNKVETEQTEPNKSPEPPVEDSRTESADELFDTLTPTLPFIVLGVLISIRALPERGNEQLPGDMIAGFSDWGRVLKALFMPINETTVQHASFASIVLLIAYAALAVVSIFALAKNKQFRQNASFLFAWLIMIVVPHLHTALTNSQFSGARLAYSAMVPTTALIALASFAPIYLLITSELKNDGAPETSHQHDSFHRSPAVFISICLVLLLVGAGLSATVSQNLAYKKAAEKLETIFQSSREIARGPNSSLTIIRDMPSDIALGEQISPNQTVMLYTQKPLLRAPQIPGGRLKDAFRDGKYRDIALRWNADENKLLPVNLEQPLTSDLKFTAPEIKRRTKPGDSVYKTTDVTQEMETLALSGSLNKQPCLVIDASGLSPLGDDFIYIDCQLETKEQESEPQIKLLWLTKLKTRYDDDRRSFSKAIANDKKFHRYFMPIRSTAWSTNGSIEELTLLFPPSSKVLIKEIGTASPEDRLPTLTFAGKSRASETAEEPRKEPMFAGLTYDYPMLPNLGLVSFDRKAEVLNLRYDSSNIRESHDCVAEISRVNHFFDLPNADDFAAKSLKTVHLDNPSGDIKLSDKDFKVDGIYSIRIFAVDKEGKLLANSSDAINCLIYTRPRRN
ncbi:hypothetical protein KF913_24235 [Candidatus Obscuribacterales bacterium]|nr:hypothetical protein [Candidatus Obscuribacterales bacterium]